MDGIGAYNRRTETFRAELTQAYFEADKANFPLKNYHPEEGKPYRHDDSDHMMKCTGTTGERSHKQPQPQPTNQYVCGMSERLLVVATTANKQEDRVARAITAQVERDRAGWDPDAQLVASQPVRWQRQVRAQTIDCS